MARSATDERDVERLLDDDHRESLLLELAHDLEQRLDGHRRKAERQLVDEQYLGFVDQRHGEGEHLLLSPGQVARRRLPPLDEDRESPECGLAAPARVAAVVQVGRHPKVLLDGQRAEHRVAAHELHDPDAGPQFGIGVGDRASVEAHDPAARHAEPADDPQQRRLARAVRAEQRDRLTVVHVEVDVEQHLHAAVAEVEVADLERGDDRVGLPDPISLGLLLEQLLDAPRDVAAHVAGSVRDQRAADQRGREHDQRERDRARPNASDRMPVSTAPKKPPNTVT